MLARCIAILLLALLTVLPAVGEASAVPVAMHCAPTARAMTMVMPQGHNHDRAAARQDCEHGNYQPQMPCAMMGLCSMTGCMAITGIAAPQVLATGQRVSFVDSAAHRLDGLALTPPLEPPRA